MLMEVELVITFYFLLPCKTLLWFALFSNLIVSAFQIFCIENNSQRKLYRCNRSATNAQSRKKKEKEKKKSFAYAHMQTENFKNLSNIP